MQEAIKNVLNADKQLTQLNQHEEEREDDGAVVETGTWAAADEVCVDHTTPFSLAHGNACPHSLHAMLRVHGTHRRQGWDPLPPRNSGYAEGAQDGQGQAPSGRWQ